MAQHAVVVDDRWYVAVASGRLPDLDTLETFHALTVEIVATIESRGATAVVCRSSGGRGLEWWPPSRAMRELPSEAQRELVRKALGPC